MTLDHFRSVMKKSIYFRCYQMKYILDRKHGQDLESKASRCTGSATRCFDDTLPMVLYVML